MSDIALTLSSPTVTLVDGKGSLALSVTNTATTPQRIVVGAFAEGAKTEGPSFTDLDRKPRTISAGGTEQFVATFDTSSAPGPGDYGVKFIAYSADGAPEDYADQGQVVTLTVAAPAAVMAKKKFPWWIAAVAGVVVIALIAGVVWFVTRTPSDVKVAWAPAGPVSLAFAGPNTYYSHLQTKDCTALATDAAAVTPSNASAGALWQSAAAVCAATKSPAKDQAKAWDAAAASFAKVTPPKGGPKDPNQCLEVAAYATASRFITAHKTNPSATIVVGDAASGEACAPQLVSVQPGIGDPSGGTMVKLVGFFTGDKLTVHVGTGTSAKDVPAVRAPDGSYSFTAPPMPQGTQNITVSDADGLLPGVAVYTYAIVVFCQPITTCISVLNQNRFEQFIKP